MPVSIREVAARAGVSVATVSNVLNRPDIVARATIDDTVERLQAGMANADAAVPDLPDGLRAVIRTQFERLAVSAA